MRFRLASVALAGLLLAVPAFGVHTILFYENECCRNITEGEFAILYCQGLKLLEPAQGWTVQTAAAALSSLGHQPQGGWVLSRFLSEAVLSQLLRNSVFYRKPFTDPTVQKSDRLVTVARARGVVPADDTLTQGEFAMLLAQALKLPVSQAAGPAEAIRALISLPVPVKPINGWNPDAPLLERDLTQALISTPYRSASVDPAMEVSALQAYSLLFGRYEVATQGHFGLFIVETLGVPAPAGGWTSRTALDFIQKEYGVSDEFGWNPTAPLCTQTFEGALRKILSKIARSSPLRAQPDLMASWGGRLALATASPAAWTPPGNRFGSGQQPPAAGGRKNVDAIIREARRSGQIPADPCETVPAAGLVPQGMPPVPPPPPPPPVSPTGPRPAPGSLMF